MTYLKHRLLIGTAALASSAVVSQGQNYSLTEIWRVDPGTQPWMTTGNTERGIGFNPITGNLLLVSRAAAMGNLSIVSLNGLTGASNGLVSVSGVSGGSGAALNMIDVASDGSIYAANLVTSVGASPFKIYRWANEGSTPTVAFNSSPSFLGTARIGDSFTVRGSGNSIQFLAGIGSSPATNNIAMFTTVDAGLTFSITGMNPGSSTVAGDGRLGIAFGPGGNTILARQGTSPKYLTFDTGTLQITGGQTLTTPGGGPIAVKEDVDGTSTDLVALLQSPNSGTTTRTVQLYDFSNTPTLVGQATNTLRTTGNANANGTGQLEFGDISGETYLFALESNNGLVAYRVAPVPEPGTLALAAMGAGLLAWRLRRKTS